MFKKTVAISLAVMLALSMTLSVGAAPAVIKGKASSLTLSNYIEKKTGTFTVKENDGTTSVETITYYVVAPGEKITKLAPNFDTSGGITVYTCGKDGTLEVTDGNAMYGSTGEISVDAGEILDILLYDSVDLDYAVRISIFVVAQDVAAEVASLSSKTAPVVKPETKPVTPAPVTPVTPSATLKTTAGLVNIAPPQPTKNVDLNYTVQAGEQLFSIAFNYYGTMNTKTINRIVAANKTRFKKISDMTKPGAVLTLPGKGIISPVTISQVANAAGVYLVKSGDSLSAIAKTYYGDMKQWTKIYEANKARVKMVGKNPMIYEGQWLLLPN